MIASLGNANRIDEVRVDVIRDDVAHTNFSYVSTHDLHDGLEIVTADKAEIFFLSDDVLMVVTMIAAYSGRGSRLGVDAGSDLNGDKVKAILAGSAPHFHGDGGGCAYDASSPFPSDLQYLLPHAEERVAWLGHS